MVVIASSTNGSLRPWGLARVLRDVRIPGSIDVDEIQGAFIGLRPGAMEHFGGNVTHGTWPELFPLPFALQDKSAAQNVNSLVCSVPVPAYVALCRIADYQVRCSGGRINPRKGYFGGPSIRTTQEWAIFLLQVTPVVGGRAKPKNLRAQPLLSLLRPLTEP